MSDTSKNDLSTLPKALNRYSAIIEKVFVNHYRRNNEAFEFTREELEGIATELGIKLPKATLKKVHRRMGWCVKF